MSKLRLGLLVTTAMAVIASPGRILSSTSATYWVKDS